jgi:hypothetical protein
LKYAKVDILYDFPKSAILTLKLAILAVKTAVLSTFCAFWVFGPGFAFPYGERSFLRGCGKGRS